ncbi:Naringenin,2-oxoglutarate 3-dioxygenase [Actinidia chinensis var. chinensis]|uniref:Naringenin,2-oxoglutarate 3-dioxygenase n=1 Tax=Actinidia chinensis var. chinensis TaxID=1590841 RepID=A0A2R6R5S9_ACTCC|nr:Naringenin,2-oxoglutarate 3-dioxygenase [Actinidia chinensis var. chinensis]
MRGLGDFPGGGPWRRNRTRLRHDAPRSRVLRLAAGGEAPVRHVRRQERRLHRFQPSTGRGSARLARDRDLLLVPDPVQGLLAMAGQAGRVEMSNGAVQREADGSRLQAARRIVGGNGPGEGRTDESLCRHGPESGGELLPQVPSTRPHARPQAPHRPRNHHALASGPGWGASGHQGRWEELDHGSACGGGFCCQSWGPWSREYINSS